MAGCRLAHIINEFYGVYHSPDDILFDDLPNSFVLKDTLDGGGNSVLLIRDKEKINISELKKAIE